MAADIVALEGQRVLVVDDDMDFREIVARKLERRGLEVRSVGDVEAALIACLDQKPDLVVMDVWMPGRSGIQACRVFREHPATADVPIILMSGQWRDEAQLYRALEAGATDVLAKEQSGVELLARVKAALRLGRVRQELECKERQIEEYKRFLAICASCKQIRTGEGEWERVETYIRRMGGLELTHGICPTCRDRLYGGVSTGTAEKA
jgi:DNA-binding response OmpR family regulator